jgi:hypothetical protein
MDIEEQNSSSLLLNDKGMSMVEIMMAIGLMSIMGIGFMKMNSNVSKGQARNKGYSEAQTTYNLLQGSLRKSEICDATFEQIRDGGSNEVSFSGDYDDTVSAATIGALKVGSQDLNKGDSYGKLVIDDYNLGLKFTDGATVAYGDFEIETSFKVDKSNTLTKKISVPIVFDVTSGKLTSCSASGDTTGAICDVFGGTLDADNHCEGMDLFGTTVNNGSIDNREGEIYGGTIRGSLGLPPPVVFNGKINLHDSKKYPMYASEDPMLMSWLTKIKLKGVDINGEDPQYTNSITGDLSNYGTIKGGTISETLFQDMTIASTTTLTDNIKDTNDWDSASTSNVSGPLFKDASGATYKLQYTCKTLKVITSSSEKVKFFIYKSTFSPNSGLFDGTDMATVTSYCPDGSSFQRGYCSISGTDKCDNSSKLVRQSDSGQATGTDKDGVTVHGYKCKYENKINSNGHNCMIRATSYCEVEVPQSEDEKICFLTLIPSS